MANRFFPFVTRTLTRSALTALTLTAVAGCTLIAKRPPPPEPGSITIIVAADSGVAPFSLEEIAAERDQIARALFYAFEESRSGQFRPLQIAFVPLPPADSNASAIDAFEPLGRYQRSSHTITLPPDASVATLRHELSHALLEDLRPGAPYWLHEGLATFAELQRELTIDACLTKGDHAAAHPAAALPRLLKRREFTVDRNFDWRKSEQLELDPQLSYYFTLYLWSRRSLPGLLEKMAERRQAEPAQLLTGGNLAAWQELESRFAAWLRGLADFSDQPVRCLPVSADPPALEGPSVSNGYGKALTQSHHARDTPLSIISSSCYLVLYSQPHEVSTFSGTDHWLLPLPDDYLLTATRQILNYQINHRVHARITIPKIHNEQSS